MIILDYNGIAISNIMTGHVNIEEGVVRHQILNSIRIYRKKHKDKFGEIVIVADGYKNWRKDVFPQYKAHRKAAQTASPFDWKHVFQLTGQIYKELQETFPYVAISMDQCEADDIIGELVRRTQEFGQGEDVLIISSDKDFAQLQKYTNVSQYSPKLKGMINDTNPRLNLQKMILGGDRADGVPNVLSKDDTFIEGLRQTPLRQDTIDKLLADPKSAGDEVYRNYLRNKKLMDLDETPQHLREAINDKYNQLSQVVPNRRKVMPYLVAHDCNVLLQTIGDFV